MNHEGADYAPPPPRTSARRAVPLGRGGLVREGFLPEGARLPLVVEPGVEGVDLLSWAAANRDYVRARLAGPGAILFRGFGVRGPEAFEQFVRRVSDEPLEYRERSSPRHRVAGNVYTSTDYPARETILLHNENSYQQVWPQKLFFFCATPSETGGETPLADVRRVLGRISPETRERFRARGVMYVRNYDEGLGLDWREVFQTEDRAAVGRYCAAAGIAAEWGEGDRLRTRQVAQAVARHPQTGEEVWFNHAAFFHVSRLDARVREALLGAVGEEHLPNNAFYGDGGPIEPAALAEVAAAYDAETVAFPWRAGDILMIDNMLVAHGRRPYTGARRILVAMTEPFARAAL